MSSSRSSSVCRRSHHAERVLGGKHAYFMKLGVSVSVYAGLTRGEGFILLSNIGWLRNTCTTNQIYSSVALFAPHAMAYSYEGYSR
ncbi:hypothetical protein CEXT_708041 [Caerostris extrusa]|uniref:Uncharacterized protein n=1 Tax=Caerostris extrusa TaxID=172846 RepID=A0AAV4RT62_CAEEX|nr:hypothetical protein CEXT_708041 [Caerostris extrusa]